MKCIDIICPVFREQATIERFYEALDISIAPLAAKYNFTITFVIDPAKDRSEEILRDIAAEDSRVCVIVMSRRFGHQAALIAGLDVVTGDAVIMLDSDLQHPPALIPELITEWEAGAEIVQALRQDDDGIGFTKRITSRLFYRLFERFSKFEINSGAADFRLLSRRVADVFCQQLREQNPFLRGLVTWVGFRLVYVPFVPAARSGGQSNYSVSALFVFAANGLCSFSKMPLRICIWLGLLFSGVSFIAGLANTAAYFLVRDQYVEGWPSLFALLSFGIGINLFFLGVLGEYIGLIFDEVKDRPRYIVDHYCPANLRTISIGCPNRAGRLWALH